MKKILVFLMCITVLLSMTTVSFAANVELYALDGRTITVDESEVDVYTAEGMGWFKEKPVTMYAADGRTIVVPADRVEAHKAVGWFLTEQTTDKQPDTSTPVNPPVDEQKTAFVKYTDGTVVKVPAEHVDMYNALGWVKVDSNQSSDTVTIYDESGNSKVINVTDLEKYIADGWSTVKPGAPQEEQVKLYYYDGQEKNVAASQVETYKAQGWYPAYDEAVYAYAAFGNGSDVLGATQLLENKKYEQAFNMVQNAIDKLEGTNSEYGSLLYYLRSTVTDTWREAANSPLGFINYWFDQKDGNNLVVFEYRNVSNSRIKFFKINFDICDNNGTVIETNSNFYYVDDIDMAPCNKKKVAWIIKSGDTAKKISNLKVKEVVFSDGTSWTAAN